MCCKYNQFSKSVPEAVTPSVSAWFPCHFWNRSSQYFWFSLTGSWKKQALTFRELLQWHGKNNMTSCLLQGSETRIFFKGQQNQSQHGRALEINSSPRLSRLTAVLSLHNLFCAFSLSRCDTAVTWLQMSSIYGSAAGVSTEVWGNLCLKGRVQATWILPHLFQVTTWKSLEKSGGFRESTRQSCLALANRK